MGREFCNMQIDQFIRPKQLAKAIGVSESTLKRWTDRGVLPTVKTVGGHRRLPLWGVIEFLRTSGQPLLRPDVLGLPAIGGAGERCDISSFRPAFEELLLGGHVDEGMELCFRAFLQGHDLAELCDSLVQPGMSNIGRRWEAGAIDVYEEHRATQMMYRILRRIRTLLRPSPDHWPLAIGGAPDGDPYGLATLMADLVLQDTGWRPVNLGPQTPLASLTKAIGDLRPRLVWLSITAPVDHDDFARAFSAISSAAAAAGASVVVGGREATPELRRRLRIGAYCVDMVELSSVARTIRPRDAAMPIDVFGNSTRSDASLLH